MIFVISGCLLFILSLIAFFYIKNKNGHQSKVKITCKTCKGTGETKQDVNLLMTQASLALWMNKHIIMENCEICSKNKGVASCENAKKVYEERMQNYRKNSPRMKMMDCPDCLGIGGYW
jgi:hypothetical protein